MAAIETPLVTPSQPPNVTLRRGTTPLQPPNPPSGGARSRLRRALEASIGTPFTAGNRVEVLRNGVEIFPAMLQAVRSARHCIEFVTFVYWTGEIARKFAFALADKARDGIGVRVILDGFGSLPMRRELIDVMVDAGVVVERFRLPVRWKFWEADHRTHRKILVVDNQTAFTGGVGIAEEWEGDARSPSEWRDTHFRIDGPAAVSLRAVFLTDWRDTGHVMSRADVEVAPSEPVGTVDLAVVDGSAQIGYSDAARAIEGMIQAADNRILIQTPYFNPPGAVCEMLTDAVDRGVDVEVVVPGPHIDKRVSAVAAEDLYSPMIDNGVKVWVYQPTMMHVKAILVDGALSLVGSVNLNRRSLAKDEEVAVAVLDDGITAILERHFIADRAKSEMGLSEIRRPAHRRVASKLVKPLSPEL